MTTKTKIRRATRHASRMIIHNDSLAGVGLSGGAAVAASAVASGHSWQVWVPLLFSLVLLVIGLLFGVRAGILGTLLAGLIFAVLLFSPLGSIRVSSAVARSNLGWMLLIGLAFSLLFAPSTSSLHRH